MERDNQQMASDGDRGMFVLSKAGGHSMERLTMSPHYCLMEHPPEGGEETAEERRDEMWRH